jgi:alpha-tubulin suppressor-like RCC1 family protein
MSLKLRYLALPGVLIAACEVPLVVQSSSPVGGSAAGAAPEGGALGNAGSPEPEAGQPTSLGGAAGSSKGGAGGAMGGGTMGEGGDAGTGGIVDTLPPCAPQHELIAQSLSAGEDHVCAVELGSGRLFCWGYGDGGQLGHGNTGTSSVPVRVLTPSLPTDPRYSKVHVGTNTTCALTEDKDLWCFGNNADGVLAEHTDTGSAEPVLLLSNVDEFTLNGNHVLARVAGQLYAWGSHEFGELGLGDDAVNPVKKVTAVAGITDAQMLAAGYRHSCITLGSSNAIYCAGSNQDHRLGIANVQQANTFTSLDRSAPRILALGYDRSCLLTDQGFLMCWGKNEDPTSFDDQPLALELPRQIGSSSDWRSVSVGFDHVCVSASDHRLLCAGRNSRGQLGNTLPGDSAVLVAPEPALESENFSAGRQFTCAIRWKDSAVVCFGANDVGQLGRGTTESTTPGAPELVCLP